MKRRDFIKILGAAGLTVPIFIPSHAKDLYLEMEATRESHILPSKNVANSVFDLQKVDSFNFEGDNNYRIDRSLSGETKRTSVRRDRSLILHMCLPDEQEFEDFISLCVHPNYRFEVVDGDIRLGTFVADSYEKFLKIDRRPLYREIRTKSVDDIAESLDSLFVDSYFTAMITMREIGG